MSLKKWVQSIANRSLFSQALRQMEALMPDQPHQVRILTYHRIEDAAGFEQQVQHLASNYHVVGVLELMEAYRNKSSLPPRSVAITFDDAYRNFAECAWPILKRYRLPAALFVPTAYPDHPESVFWWDRLEHAFKNTTRRDTLETFMGQLPLASSADRVRAFKRLREGVKTLPHTSMLERVDQICTALGVSAPLSSVLGWDALRRLSVEGVTLGAHTRTHPLLNQIPLVQARSETLESLEDLRREIGDVAPIFAYPGGGYTPAVVDGLRRDGFEFAFTTMRGINDLRKVDPLLLRRNNIGLQATWPVLQARLLQAKVS